MKRYAEFSVQCPRCGNDCLEVRFEDASSEYTIAPCDCSTVAWTPSERETIIEDVKAQMRKDLAL